MKIFTTSVLLSSLLAALASVDAAPKDVGFKPDDMPDHGNHANGTHHIKSAANLRGAGAQIQLCPTGDCTNGQAITLSMARLQEFDDDGRKPFVQEAENFNTMSAQWTTFEPITIGGVDAVSASFISTFNVGNATTATSFNLTAVIYQNNGTALNGNQTVDVPAGALKFSVLVKDWPFLNTTNHLRFGVALKAQGKDKKECGPGKKNPKGDKKHMDRVSMGEGMFMDAPTLAVIDDVTTPINSTVEPHGNEIELVWVFPSFTKSLYYDPVLGADNSTNDTSAGATNGTTTTPTNTTTTPTTTTAKPSSSASQIVGALVAGVLAAVGAALL